MCLKYIESNKYCWKTIFGFHLHLFDYAESIHCDQLFSVLCIHFVPNVSETMLNNVKLTLTLLKKIVSLRLMFLFNAFYFSLVPRNQSLRST